MGRFYFSGRPAKARNSGAPASTAEGASFAAGCGVHQKSTKASAMGATASTGGSSIPAPRNVEKAHCHTHAKTRALSRTCGPPARQTPQGAPQKDSRRDQEQSFPQPHPISQHPCVYSIVLMPYAPMMEPCGCKEHTTRLFAVRWLSLRARKAEAGAAKRPAPVNRVPSICILFPMF